VTLSEVTAARDTPPLALAITSQNGAVSITGPTAATVAVGGRVLTSDGRGITNVRVTLTDASGALKTTTTGEAGYYRFSDVEVGATYIVTATGKRFSFSQPTQVINLTEDETEVNFIGTAQKRLRVF